MVASSHGAGLADGGREPGEGNSRLKNILLFLASPFFGLAYMGMLPFAGAAVVTKIVFQEADNIPPLRKATVLMKKAAMFIAAPFVGIAYLVIVPFAALAMVIWNGLTGAGRRR